MKNAFFSDMFNEAKKHFIDGNYKVAEPMLQQMILQNHRDPEVYQMLATILYDKGQFNKAIKTFKRALEIDPTYTDASVGLSIILNDLGRYEEGKKVFQEAQAVLDNRNSKMDPYIEEKLAGKHEELADLYYQYKKYSEALDQLLKAAKLSTRRAEITMRIVECHLKMADHDRAIKELRSLIRDYPQFSPARMKLGLIYYNLNHIAEATEQWESILLRDPHHSEALKHLKLAQDKGFTVLNT